MYDIVIIGGGASGVILALQLHEQALAQKLKKKSIAIIEKDDAIGLGLAYNTSEILFLLNVAVGKMSAYSNKPDDLQEWLQKKGIGVAKHEFISRGLYGEYLKNNFNKLITETSDYFKITHIKGEAIGINPKTGTTIVNLSNGSKVQAKKVVLAFGNFPPSPLKVRQIIEHKNFIKDPWKFNLTEIGPHDNVLIIGTGLTMIDIIIALDQNGHKGQITALSTHGYLPLSHKLPLVDYKDLANEIQLPLSPLSLFKLFKKHLKTAEASKIDWRSVVDSLRPLTQQIWFHWSLSEKQTFMRHLRHIWGVARHRTSPRVADYFSRLLSDGRVGVVSGRLDAILESRGNFSLTYHCNRERIKKTIDTKWIINCTGPESNYEKITMPIVRDLRRQGILMSDPMKLGINATVNGELINKDGEVSEVFYTLGPPLKGILWESTAIPDIREQALKLAKILLHEKIETLA